MRRRRSSDTLLDHQPPRKRGNFNNCTETLPEDIKCGDVITDITAKKWRLGKSIGSGAFGKIYLVSDTLIREPVKDAEYVAKLEPHDSGPLFVEMNCYLRAAKLEMINEWLTKKMIHEIGMPHYIATGSYKTMNDRYRFLILPRYGTDLETIFQMKNKQFNLKTVLTVSIQVLDILEYIHSKGYVHSDIKGSNLLLGTEYNKEDAKKSRRMKSSTKTKRINNPSSCSTREKCPNQVYLLDYGLASRFMTNDGQQHKEYCDDERKAHAGTVQFCSRDAHKGCTARRSDLENLGYNMIYWLTAKLPWDDLLDSDPNEVHNCKCESMQNLDKFLTTVLGNCFPKCIYKYLQYVKKLSFKQKPDYDYCRKLLCAGLIEFGYSNDNYLDFDRNCDIFNKKLLKKVKKQSENIRGVQKVHAKILYDRKPLGINSQVMLKPTLRSAETRELRKQKFNWADVLSSDPEHILRQNKNIDHGRSRKNTENSDTIETNVLNIDLTKLNPTYAMLEVVNRAQERLHGHLKGKVESSVVQKHEGYTPAMEYVFSRKIAREKEEFEQKAKEHSEKLAADNFSPRFTRSKGKVVMRLLPTALNKKRVKAKYVKKIRLTVAVNNKRSGYSLRG